MSFLDFMNSLEGKSIRNVLGALLIGFGFIMHSRYWYIVSIVGIIPILAATYDYCILSVFFPEK